MNITVPDILTLFISKKIYEAKMNGDTEVIIPIHELEEYGYVHKIHESLLRKILPENLYHMKIYSNHKNWDDKRIVIFWDNKEVNINGKTS